jgi:hypothetical protein
MTMNEAHVGPVAIPVKTSDSIEKFNLKLQAIGICVQLSVPFLLIGPPGNAKTAIVEAIFRQLCALFYTSIPALNDPAHYAGYPSKGTTRIPDGYGEGGHDVDVAIMLPNEWALRLSQASKGGKRVGLFFDELSSAPPATRAACLRGILQGTWGDFTIDNSSPGAAMNPPEIAEAGYDLSAPLANRFAQFQWDPPVEWWNEQRMMDFPDPQIIKLPADWQKNELRVKIMHSAFCQFKPAVIQKCPDQATERSKPWPSFRTWTWGCKLVAAAISVGGTPDSDLAYILLSAAVGPGPAIEFLAYCNELELPNPEDLLKNPMSLSLPQRGDRAYAVLTSVVAAVIAHNTPERWNAAWEVLARAVEVKRADVGATAARMLGKNRPEGWVRAPKSIAAFIPMLKAAGLMGT